MFKQVKLNSIIGTSDVKNLLYLLLRKCEKEAVKRNEERIILSSALIQNCKTT